MFSKLASSPQAPRHLMGRPEAQELSASRMPVILAAVLLWALAILCRLIWLQGIEHRKYRQRADQQHTTTVPVPAIRGEVRDRRGNPLAISLEVQSLFCTPADFYPDYRRGRVEGRSWGDPDRESARSVAQKLAPILEQPVSRLTEKLLRKKPFVWIERQLPASKVAAIKALKLDGLEFMKESKRYYPRGSLACQILGFTNIDGQGQLGIENAYNTQLAGRGGELIAPRDAKGRLLILQENFAKVPVNGSTLQLSLDATIQHIVERELDLVVQQLNPKNAYAVVMDPNTGEILAMAGTPSYDPNHVLPKKFMNRSESELSAAEKDELKRELERQKMARKVHPVEDSYEPGSTMKVFTSAIALEERKVRLGEKIDCAGGRWKFSSKLTITDTHHNGVLSFEEVLWHSSNVGTAKIGLRLDPAVHYQYLRKFGFGEPSGLNFPGETAGRLLSPDRWSGTTQPTMCYGYGLSTSPLQILTAACAIANGGKLMEPILVQKIFNDQGVLLQEHRPKVRGQVLSEETSALMKEALKGVVTSGTAKKAKLEGTVEVFGKTGTARKFVPGQGYDPRKHYSSFLGFFPSDKPQYGILVMLDEPGGGLTGGDIAAPVFKKIGDAILRYRATGLDDQEPDLKLSLRDWPTSENDEAVVHVEIGKVPELKGLTLKSAIHRVVLAGGLPRVEGGTGNGPTASRVTGQSPETGKALEPGKPVKILLGGT